MKKIYYTSRGLDGFDGALELFEAKDKKNPFATYRDFEYEQTDGTAVKMALEELHARGVLEFLPLPEKID